MSLVIGSIVVALVIAWLASVIGVGWILICGVVTFIFPPVGIILTIIVLILSILGGLKG